MPDFASTASPSRGATTPAFVLPPLVRAMVSRLPAFPPAVVCAFTLSLIAPRVVGRDALATLDGKTFRIVVRDAGASVAFRVRSARFEPLRADRAVDVTFTACAADFLLMATRRADPDTLFFDRRLLIEGDTETGLRLKNILDAVELPRWLTGA
jgi:O2-independent ubiquinone biosynthesis accessory factor UbiT